MFDRLYKGMFLNTDAASGNAGGSSAGSGESAGGGASGTSPSSTQTGAASSPNFHDDPDYGEFQKWKATKATTDQATQTARSESSGFDTKALKDEVMGEFRLERARDEHRAELSKVPDLVKAKAVEFAGGDATLAEFLASHIERKIDSAREPYPDGHPLAGMKKPASQATIDKWTSESKFEDTLKNWRGGRVRSLGEAANRGAKVPPVASPNTGNSGPAGEPADPRREARAKAEKRLAEAGIE